MKATFNYRIGGITVLDTLPFSLCPVSVPALTDLWYNRYHADKGEKLPAVSSTQGQGGQ